MANKVAAIAFNEDHASSYDGRFSKVSQMKDALHLTMELVLSELPVDARILCIGAGTGAELIYLAESFPQWQLTAVEPAAAMLAICRTRAEESGIAARCTFHEGYLDSLPAGPPFDAATSILVSHFLLEREERCAFFHQIAARLLPGGYLINADLAGDQSASTHKSLFHVWKRMLAFTGMSAREVDEYMDIFAEGVSLLPPEEVASVMVSGGFTTPVSFFQALLIHGWYARRAG